MRKQSVNLKIFISSVQKEFAAERRALKTYLTHDPLLSRFIDDVFLFEDVPACNQRPDELYLPEVGGCDVYLALLGDKYGWKDANGKSPTELEFEHATHTQRERLVFVKGDDNAAREPEMAALVRRASQQVTRRRFTDTPGLIREVYASLVDVLERRGALRLTPFDDTPCPGATLADIDDARVADFVAMAEEKGRLTLKGARTSATVLQNFNLVRDGFPTNAAVLLFGKHPARFINTAQVHCFHFLGVEKRKPIASQQPYEGTLFEVIDQAVEFVLGKLDRRVGTRAEGSRAPVAYEIPRSVVTEAIVNAVAHRNYASTGFVQVLVFADRVEVWNPGELPPGLTPELLREPHGPIPRNPLIAEPLFRVQFVEKAGTGTTDMIADCREAGLPEPVFEQHGPHFVVTLWRDWLTAEVLARLGLNAQQMAAVRQLKSSGRISNSEYRALTGASESTALRELRHLVAHGIIEKANATGQAAHYVYVKRKPVTNPSSPSAGSGKGTRHEPIKPVMGKAEKGRVTPEVTPKSGVESGVESRFEPGVESGMARQLLAILAQEPSGKSGMAERLGKAGPTRYLNDLVAKLIHQRLIEMTLPDKPNSRLQKYRLTAAGVAMTKRMDTRVKA